MGNDLRLRQIKGFVISWAFLGMALAMLQSPSGLTVYMDVFGITPTGWVLFLSVSAIGTLYVGLRGKNWNAVWFAPIICYTVAAILAYVHGTAPIPAFTVVSYTLLSALLLIEVGYDIFRESRTWLRAER